MAIEPGNKASLNLVLFREKSSGRRGKYFILNNFLSGSVFIRPSPANLLNDYQLHPFTEYSPN
jgi:hypothetical protein